jgi:hypothetical protein
MAPDWDFFLAHAGANKAQAEELYGYLNGQARVFLDSHVLLYGDDWDAELAKAQRAALITLVLVSAQTEQAYYEREEIAAAIAMARRDEAAHRVIPIFLNDPEQRDTHVPYGLRLKHGIYLSADTNLKDAAVLLLEQLPKVKSYRGDRVTSALPSSSPPDTTPDEPSPIRIAPTYSLEAVNRAIVLRVLLQSGVVLGLAVVARLLWAQPALLNSLGLTVENAEVPNVLNRAVWYGSAGILALVLVWMQWMDTQFVFSLGRVLLFVSVLALFCAAVCCAPGISPWFHGLLLTAFVVAGSFYYFGFGMARYYWKRNSYGDLAAEGMIFFVFVYSMRRPLMMLFGGK